MIKLTQLITQKIRLVEYSEKLMKELVMRYKRQNSNLDEATIRAYIERFSQLKDSIKQRFTRGDEIIVAAIPEELKEKFKFLDINLWKKWSDLEKIVDIFPESASARKATLDQFNDAEGGGDKVYDSNQLEIYRGDAKHKCIKYGNTMGNSYTWCISRNNSQNMYDNYRFMKQDSRNFYFVFDRSRSSRKNGDGFADVYHAVVIHVYEDGRYGFSNASNSGDSSSKDWNGLSQFMPAELWAKLRGLQSVFKYTEPSEDEKVAAVIAGKDLTFDQFKTLSYKNKLLVINSGRKLTTDMVKILDTDLKSQYINMFQRMPFECVSTNLPLIKRYIIQQFDRKGNAINADYLEYMDDEQKKKYFEKYSNESAMNYSHIAKYFPEYAPTMVAEYVSQYIYLPDYMEKFMTPQQKMLWEAYMPAYFNTKIEESDNNNDLVKEYYLVPEPLTEDAFRAIDSSIKPKFVALMKKLVANHTIGNTDCLLTQLLPDATIKDGALHLKFDNKLVNVEALNESRYDNRAKFEMLRRAGLIK